MVPTLLKNKNDDYMINLTEQKKEPPLKKKEEPPLKKKEEPPLKKKKSSSGSSTTKKKELEVVQTPDETGKSIYIDQKEYPNDLYIKLYQVEYMRNEIYSQSYPFIKSIQDGLSNPNLDMPLTGSDFNPGWQD